MLFVLCPCSLKLMEEKGYAGGLGASASRSAAYRPSREVDASWRTDDLGESFTVCGFLFLWRHEHMNCKDLVLKGSGRCAKVRRQG